MAQESPASTTQIRRCPGLGTRPARARRAAADGRAAARPADRGMGHRRRRTAGPCREATRLDGAPRTRQLLAQIDAYGPTLLLPHHDTARLHPVPCHARAIRQGVLRTITVTHSVSFGKRAAQRTSVRGVIFGAVLPSWSCGFDSRRPLSLFRRTFRTLSGCPLGATCPLRIAVTCVYGSLANSSWGYRHAQDGRLIPSDDLNRLPQRLLGRARTPTTSTKVSAPLKSSGLAV
jgi:hypothetical protein